MSATPHDAKINGHEFTVRQNLYAALVPLRDSVSPIRPWVDAVCINQASISERNSQVPLMRDICSTAAKVLIWLEEGNNATDHAIGALHKLATLCQDSDWVFTDNDLHKLLPEDTGFVNFPADDREKGWI
jgi:hypothetical protein